MAAQGESQLRPTMGDWQEDVVEAREILRSSEPTTIAPQHGETPAQYRHRLHVLQADPARLMVLRGQHVARALAEDRDTVLPLVATCGTCGTRAVRSVTISRDRDTALLRGWVHHYQDQNRDGSDNDTHPVLPTFPEET